MVVSPSDGPSLEALLRSTVDHDGPVYFRLGRGRDPHIHNGPDVVTGPGEPITVAEGSGELIIVSTGSMVAPCIAAAKLLQETQGHPIATVLDVHTIKPFYGDRIAAAAANGARVLVVEEHNTEGGLGTIVIEALLERGVAPTVYKHGLYDEFVIVGPPAHLYKYYGLSREGIATIGDRLIKSTGRPAPRSLWTGEDRQRALTEVLGSREDRVIKRV